MCVQCAAIPPCLRSWPGSLPPVHYSCTQSCCRASAWIQLSTAPAGPVRSLQQRTGEFTPPQRSSQPRTHTHESRLFVVSLLVLGLRNMEGSVDPTKLVSQFLVRKTLVQVRRRILQCCRPGFPDNIVKVTREQRAPVGPFRAVSDPFCAQAYRYQRVLWPMAVACRHVHPAEQRPPVEREERTLPLWLAVCDVITSVVVT